MCDKDLAELSGELSGAICLKTLVLQCNALELFRNFFDAVRASIWLCESFWPLNPFKQFESADLATCDVSALYFFVGAICWPFCRPFCSLEHVEGKELGP